MGGAAMPQQSRTNPLLKAMLFRNVRHEHDASSYDVQHDGRRFRWYGRYEHAVASYDDGSLLNTKWPTTVFVSFQRNQTNIIDLPAVGELTRRIFKKSKKQKKHQKNNFKKH